MEKNNENFFEVGNIGYSVSFAGDRKFRVAVRVPFKGGGYFEKVFVVSIGAERATAKVYEGTSGLAERGMRDYPLAPVGTVRFEARDALAYFDALHSEDPEKLAVVCDALASLLHVLLKENKKYNAMRGGVKVG